MTRCELGHQPESTFEKLRSHDGKDDRILDLAIHYALNNSYQVTEELTKY